MEVRDEKIKVRDRKNKSDDNRIKEAVASENNLSEN